MGDIQKNNLNLGKDSVNPLNIAARLPYLSDFPEPNPPASLLLLFLLLLLLLLLLLGSAAAGSLRRPHCLLIPD